VHPEPPAVGADMPPLQKMEPPLPLPRVVGGVVRDKADVTGEAGEETVAGQPGPPAEPLVAEAVHNLPGDMREAEVIRQEQLEVLCKVEPAPVLPPHLEDHLAGGMEHGSPVVVAAATLVGVGAAAMSVIPMVAVAVDPTMRRHL
jgi:hypothetical protein